APIKRKRSGNASSDSSRSVTSAISAAASAISKVTSKAKAGAKKLKNNISGLITRHKSQSSEAVGTEPIEISDEENLSPKAKAQIKFDRLKVKWTAPVYSFFKPPTLKFDGDRPYHSFHCASTTCKYDAKVVKRYADTTDATGTSNLKKHARRCFGAEVVDAAIAGAKVDSGDSSIHAAFGQQSAKPARAPNRPLTYVELRATLARWFTESNRPMHAVEDRKFVELILNGRPGLTLPSESTVARDIQKAFERSIDRVTQLLKEYPGKLSFGTDAWTSPNHRAFVAWTVHLQHEGAPLSFMVDIFE
ncbi:hypothetical protein B0H13DRAFT_2403549, partial [Mycena leptocephala]